MMGLRVRFWVRAVPVGADVVVGVRGGRLSRMRAREVGEQRKTKWRVLGVSGSGVGVAVVGFAGRRVCFLGVGLGVGFGVFFVRRAVGVCTASGSATDSSSSSAAVSKGVSGSYHQTY